MIKSFLQQIFFTIKMSMLQELSSINYIHCTGDIYQIPIIVGVTTVHDLKVFMNKKYKINNSPSDFFIVNNKNILQCYHIASNEISESDTIQAISASKGVGKVSVDKKSGELIVKPIRSDSELPSFNVKMIHISCASDNYFGECNYGGFVLWGKTDSSDVFYLGERKCRPGYLVIVNTNRSDVKCHNNEDGQVHGMVFKHVFGVSLRDVESVIGEGFAVVNGEIRFNSCTFNQRSSDYHDGSKSMNSTTQTIIKTVLEEWMTGDCEQNYPVSNIIRSGILEQERREQEQEQQEEHAHKVAQCNCSRFSR